MILFVHSGIETVSPIRITVNIPMNLVNVYSVLWVIIGDTPLRPSLIRPILHFP